MQTIRLASLIVLSALLAAPAAAGTCQKEFGSTFEMIQSEIFEKHGCTNQLCHGATAAGGLDLRAGVAFDNLVDAAVGSLPADTPQRGTKRVVPGRKDLSLLWLNLAAATIPDLWQAPLRSMPVGAAPLTFDELEVVRLWIEQGATRDGIIPETAALIDACLPPPRPLKTEPLPPPPAGLGVQLRAPHQVLAAQSEREVCFVSWFDFSDQVPEQFLSPDGEHFRVKFNESRQDPLSHHLNAMVYRGKGSIDSPEWGDFTCKLGPHDGQSCDPQDPQACGAGGICGSEPSDAPVCIGFGPDGDAIILNPEESLFNPVEAASSALGVYEEVPLRGIALWNSHAFNIYDEPAGLDVWVNFYFAAPEEQLRPRTRFVEDTRVMDMAPPAYGVDELCGHWVAPEDVQVLSLSSHQHKRGKRFRIFEGAFTCQGGPNDGQPCSPYGPDPGLPLTDPCAGARCASRVPPEVGDCSGDLRVSVDELVTGVNIALALADPEACLRFDGNADAVVTVDELTRAVRSAVNETWRDPDASLLYLSLSYADPVVLRFDPPLEPGGATSVAAERTFTYCGFYDNGFTDPDTVKRNSATPPNGQSCKPTHCTEGLIGTECVGSTIAARNASCDSAPEADDGFCDACTAGFGVTTEDEMFVMVGAYIKK